MINFLIRQTAVLGTGIQDSAIVTGTQKLLSDLTTWAMIIAPIIGGVAITYFLIRRSWADEMDQKAWTKRIATAVISTVAAVLGTALLSVILGYFI